MSVELALDRAGASTRDADTQAPLATAAMLTADITTNTRARYFIAQIMHECGGFYYREELASGEKYEGRRDLGNVQRGDGVRFKGRGWIQITGRANYQAAGRAIGVDLVANPKLASTSRVAWQIAAWYWSTRKLNDLADASDFLAITKRINGGTNGYEDRLRRLRLIQGVDCRPVAPSRYAGFEDDEAKALRDYWDWKRRGVNLEGRKRLRADMKVMRKKVWRAGDTEGWTALRRRRWNALKDATS